MDLERAQESLQAAASRAYYAMFQAAQVALETAGFTRASWSHAILQATFTTELIARRKAYPAVFRDYLSTGIRIRHVADYGGPGVSQKVARRILRRATAFVAAVQEAMPQ